MVKFSSSYDPLGTTVYNEINNERIQAHNKHKDKPNGGSMEERDWRDGSWTPVVNEEWGEVSRVLNELRHENLTEEEAALELRKELIQTAAMCMAWVESIDGDVDHDGY